MLRRKIFKILLVLLVISGLFVNFYIPSKAVALTTTFYTSASDGQILATSVDFTDFNTAWAATTGSKADTIGTSMVGVYQASVSPYNYYIWRSFLYFDTSAIPDTATITAATLYLYGSSKQVLDDSNINILNPISSTYPHDPMQATDYNKDDYGTTSGGAILGSAWSTSGYNAINLNATGLTWISKTGYTKFALRNGFDIAGTFTFNSWVAFYTYEQGVGFRPKLDITYTIEKPTVTTDAATDTPAATSVTLNGSITNTGGATVDYYGFVVNTTAIADPANTDPSLTGHLYFKSTAGDYGVSSQLHNFTGLIIGTTYHFRFCAHNSEGWIYGSDRTFTNTAKATILSQNATLVTATSARLQSYLQNTGGTGITCSVQFGYGTTSQAAANFHLYTTRSGFAGNYTSGTYPYLDITSLTPSTRYYYRVQARNGAGNATCTLEQSFLTESGVGTPSNLLGTPNTTSIVLTWTKGLGASNSYLRYKVGTPPTTVTNGTLIYSSTASTYTLTGLIVGQTYGFSVWGYDGSATYSAGYVSYVVTTLAAVSQEIATPTTSGNFFFEPSLTAFDNNPAKVFIDFMADATSMPRGTAYFITALLVILGVTIIVLFVSHGNLIMAAACLGVGSLGGLFMGLLSFWAIIPMIFVAIIMYMIRDRV